MFIFLTFVNSTEEGHICRPPLRSERLVVFFKGFFIALEGSILEELAALENCGGTPLHAWDQLQETWTAMLVVRGVMLAEWSNSGTGSGLLRKGEIGIRRKARYL